VLSFDDDVPYLAGKATRVSLGADREPNNQKAFSYRLKMRFIDLSTIIGSEITSGLRPANRTEAASSRRNRWLEKRGLVGGTPKLMSLS
jgi:hypothetical protein